MSLTAKKGKIHEKENKAKQSKFHLMLRKKLVQERRENAEKKKSANKGTEPENRITQNVLPQDTPIFASPPAYQDIYSKVPMPAMVPLPIFYYDDQESSGDNPGGNEIPDEDIIQGFYPEPEGMDEPEGSAELISKMNPGQFELPDENTNPLDGEDEGMSFAESESGDAANDIFKDAKNIEQGEGVDTTDKAEGEASNRDDTAAPQGGGDQAAAKPAAGQEAAGQQPAGQQPPQPAKEEDKG